jgi:polysaccharide biosynthesis/export protein
MYKNIAIIIVCTLLFSSCKVLRPSLMLKTKRSYKYANIPQTPLQEYRISANDVIDFKIFSNDGFRLVDVTGDQSPAGGVGRSSTYKVEFDGAVKLPILDYVPLKGMTIREAEAFLEEKYSVYYKSPYILLSVTNRRVIVFPGNEGAARVLPLTNDNTTLMEALALSGGVPDIGKAYRIKLIRGDSKQPEVYLINLSTIDGLKEGNVVLQANDIIYVEPRPRYAYKVISELAPYISILSSAIIVTQLINR